MLILGDCLKEHKKIKDGIVDLILTDLPYGTVKGANLDGWGGNKTDWDVIVPTKEVFKIGERVLRRGGKMLLFAQQPFTTELINNQTNNLPHNYNIIWEKDHFANALTAKKAPVNFYEDICVFSKKYDLECVHPLRAYFKQVLDFISVSVKEINNILGHRRAEHCFYIETSQFGICTEKTYNELIEVFSIDKMCGFKSFGELAEVNQIHNSTFNLWDGKKYKSNILKYKKDYEGLHPTQKPILLLEDLIKTYTNKGDLVLDLTMGSGSTGVACKNTEREFIGIEKDEEYFNTAYKRITSTTANT